MSVSTNISRSGPYAGAGTVGPFTVGFRFLDQTHLLVVRTSSAGIETILVLGTDYTVAGAGSDSGGSVTLTVALAIGTTLTIQRNVPLTQLADYTQSDSFPAQSHEDALDKLTMIAQQEQEQLNGALRVPETTAVLPAFPALALRKNTIAGFDSSGNPSSLYTLPVGSFTTGQAFVDAFTGDGSTVAFTLSQNPGAQANLAVSVGGVVQRNGVDFTWTSGTTLTFTSPPPNLVPVQARYTNAVPAGVAAASNVTTQQAGASTVPRSVETELRDWLKPEQFGAVGDGVTDDAAALNTASTIAAAMGRTLYLSRPYSIGSTFTVLCDLVCDQGASIVPKVSIGANQPAVVIASTATDYSVKRTVRGLVVAGSATLRAALINGIRVDRPNTTLDRCSAYTFGYGWIVRSFSVTLRQCNGFLCNTNLSAYARDTSHEINALHLDGGNWDSAVNVGWNIGDTSWGDAMAAGTNQHGVGIVATGMPNFDGAHVRVDNVYGVTFEGYFEGIGSATEAIRLGGSGDGNLRNVVINGCYFSGLPHAIKCYSGVSGLVVRPSFYTGVTKSALYLTTNLYPFRYERGVSSGSFAQGQEVHTGFPSVALAAVTFGYASIPYQGLLAGVQSLTAAVNNSGPSPTAQWYPGGTLITSGPTNARMNASAAGRFYGTPLVTKAGTVASNVFTFTTLSDCYGFNGGDQITTAPGGATYVRSVDYVAGTAVLDGGTTANGAATISQLASTFRTETVTGTGTPPTTGSWRQGDIAWNGVAAAGAAPYWARVTTGSANVLGTDWKATANL